MTIMEKVRELQQLIKDEYGYDANIDIKVHSHQFNEYQATKEGLNKLSIDIVNQLNPNDISIYANRTGDSVNWIHICAKDFAFIGFYREPVVKALDVEVETA